MRKSTESDLERKSPEAIAWRTAIYRRDNYTCQICGERGGNLAADHIRPWALFPEHRYDMDNGRTLCVACHRQTPTYGNRRLTRDDVLASLS